MAFEHMNGDHLLNESCSWEAYTGTSEAANYSTTEQFATAETLACLRDEPGFSWMQRWPNPDQKRRVVLWLPQGNTVGARDRITFDSVVYRVLEVRNWEAAYAALLEGLEGMDES